jgi:hypothetical protein
MRLISKETFLFFARKNCRNGQKFATRYGWQNVKIKSKKIPDGFRGSESDGANFECSEKGGNF